MINTSKSTESSKYIIGYGLTTLEHDLSKLSCVSVWIYK